MKNFATAIAMVVALSSPGVAADLDPEVFEAPPELAPVAEPTSGWYLRGDVNYTMASKNKGNWDFWNQFPADQGVDDTFQFDSLKLRGTAGLGVGVGYRFNETFRSDVTVDYFRAKVDGKTRCPMYIRSDADHQINDLINGTCDYNYASSAKILAPMLNAYADLPTFGRITPYAGLGIGAAYVSYADAAMQENCPDCTSPTYTPYSATNPGMKSWRFAASAMAGAAIRVTDSALVDLGYKYTRVGAGNMWEYDAADKAFNASGAQHRDNGFDVHAVRLGVRYEMN